MLREHGLLLSFPWHPATCDNDKHIFLDPLEKEMATHSSILAWEIPWTEEPGGLQVHGVAKSQTRLND